MDSYPHSFDDFIKLISGVLDGAVLNTLDLKYKLLQDDLKHNQLDLTDDACSILYFMMFVRATTSGKSIPCIVPLPPDHIEFYKKTIVRLVQAEQLPPSAMDNFDFTFVPAA